MTDEEIGFLDLTHKSLIVGWGTERERHFNFRDKAIGGII